MNASVKVTVPEGVAEVLIVAKIGRGMTVTVMAQVPGPADLLGWSEPNRTVFAFDEEHILSEEDIETQHAIMNSIKAQQDAYQAKDHPAASRVSPLVWYLAGGTGTPPTREGMKKMVQDMGVWRVGRGHEA